MIIKQDEVIEVENLDEVESITGSISAENMSFALTMLSASFYSNPIGSIVRELTSNCWDSHVEAGVNTPIVISIEKDYENVGEFIISFKDEGIGLSEERFNNIYPNWFSSTKRGTNRQKGGFGLGSKSPFSYTDQFYITTIYNGQERGYIAYKANNEFKFDKLYSKESEAHNGTTVKLNIKNYDDRWSFAREIKRQLCYFSNVIAKSNYDTFDNDYAIFELEHFKARSNTPYTEMHILLGEAVYPIDWNQLNINKINIPIAIPFEIGTLQVTPNREQLQYNPEIIEVIKNKIKLACEEAIGLFLEQNPSYDDLFEYIKHRGDNPLLVLEDRNRLVGLDLESIGCPKKITYSPLKEIGKLPDYPFAMFKVLTIKNGQIKRNKEGEVTHIFHPTKNDYPRNYYFTKYLNSYSNRIVKDGKVVMPIYYSNKDYFELLNLKTRRGASRNFYKALSNEYQPIRPVLGAAKLILQYKREINRYVRECLKPYPVLTESQIKEMKREQAEKAKAAKLDRKLNGTCFIYYGSSRYETPIRRLASHKVLFYYINTDVLNFDPSILNSWLSAAFKPKKFRVYDGRYANGKKVVKDTYNNWLPFEIIKINETNYKLIKHLPNLVHLDKFFKTPELYPALNRTYYSNQYKGFAKDINFDIFSKYYKEKLEKLNKFVDTNYDSSNHYLFVNTFLDNIKAIPVRRHKSVVPYINIKKELDQVISKFKFTEYISRWIPDKYKEDLKKTFLKGIKHLDYYGDTIDSKRTKYDPDRRWEHLQQESGQCRDTGGNENSIQGNQREIQQSEIDEVDQAIREKYGTGEEEGTDFAGLFESIREEDQERSFEIQEISF